MKTFSLILVFLLIINGDAFTQIIAKNAMKSKRGDTRSKGSYILKKDKNNVVLKLKLNVRKSGVFGTGKGAFALVVFDKNYKPVLDVSHGLTVGADVLKGVADKSWKRNITYTGGTAKKILKEGLILAFSVITKSDKRIIPTSLDEWGRVVNEVSSFATDIKKLPVGKEILKGDWRFKKIR